MVTIEKCFNVREGARREDDRLPWRMMNEPVPEGANKGMVTDAGHAGEPAGPVLHRARLGRGDGHPAPGDAELLGLEDVCVGIPARLP